MSVKKPAVQRSDSFPLAACLAVAGGFLDAYTYLIRGGVFANAQTGNIVLLGLHLAKGEGRQAVYYMVPILAFALGIVLAEWIRRLPQPLLHWRQWTLGLEILLLGIAAFVPVGSMDLAVNIGVSFVCAIQVESFRTVHGSAYASTMCTGNLRSGTEALYEAIRTGSRTQLRKSLQYYGIILCFIAGAALGTLLAGVWGGISILCAAGILVIPLILMFF